MEVAGQSEKGTLLTAVLALLVIGFTLVLSTWQMLRQQQDAGVQYLAVSAKSIAQTIENTFRRQWRLEGHREEAWSGMQDLFSDFGSNSDLLYIEILDEKGRRVFLSRQGRIRPVLLQRQQLDELARGEEWYSVQTLGERNFFAYASRIALQPAQPPESSQDSPASQASRTPKTPRVPQPSQVPLPSGSPAIPKAVPSPQTSLAQVIAERNPAPNPFAGTPAYLVIGMSMERSLGVYASFRQNAILQSLYILAAAVFIWGLSVSLMSRRALVGKARVLERFQAKLWDNLPDGLITVNAYNEIQAANPAAHRLLDFNEGTMAGKRLEDLPSAFVDSLQLSEFEAKAEGFQESGPKLRVTGLLNTDFGQEIGHEFGLPLKDGQGNIGWLQAEVGGKQLEILLSSFRGEDESPVRLLLIRDRTRLNTLERSLAQAEKMAAVGTLAAGVAHEIRNPLSALRGFAQYFAKKFAGIKPDEEYAKTMVREADRLNRVITDLLYLARSKKAEFVQVNLLQIVDEVAALLRFDLEAGKVGLRVDLQVAQVLADADSIKQALLNLILNSLDALGEKREAGRSIQLNWKPEITVRSFQRDDWIVLEVEDNGIGMDEERKKQAFEAFYTSKAKGTGLGLSLVDKTAREHGGRAVLECRPGGGCKLSLYFMGERPKGRA
ncbi:MAG: PAS domain-containing sensor histidine kinase [Deltaproteobacteria bacterium]|jgi:signal transduction histidine kinase|nr:PAS domain-containing sensor histidine kinase [Deltaproteobacteria bacterium]